MKTKWLTMFAGVVTAIVFVSITLGFANPDGSVGDKPTAGGTPKASSTASSEPAGTPTPTADLPSAERAPASVTGVWPGHPAAAPVVGDKVNWCPAVRITGAGEAQRTFGAAAVDAAACDAVRFVFEQRYSRLSIPQKSYKRSSFDFVMPALNSSTASQVYRPRIDAFVADPGNVSARDALGLVLLRGAGTSHGHTSAGLGRVYYGKAYTTGGYRDRAVWINPKWSKVAISVDRSTGQPRIAAKLTAKASIPVFNPSKKRDEMLEVATSATYFLLHGDGTAWSINGWTVTTKVLDFAPLSVK